MKKMQILCLICLMLCTLQGVCLSLHAQNNVRVAPDSLVKTTGTWMRLYEQRWSYHAGDSGAYAHPMKDDSSWEQVLTTLESDDSSPKTEWTGIGWFRLRLDVDSALVSKPIGFFMIQQGASEVYLDGTLLYRFGAVAADAAHETLFVSRMPHIVIFRSAGIHTLAVRYSNHSTKFFRDANHFAGFKAFLYDAELMTAERMEDFRWFKFQETLFLTVNATFAFLHLCIFAFYPRLRINLFYALAVLCFGVSIMCGFERTFVSNPMLFVRLHWYSVWLQIATFLLLALFSYSLVHRRIPRRYWLLVVFGSVVGMYQTLPHGVESENLFILWIALITAEMVGVSLFAFRQKVSLQNQEGKWIIAVGACFPLFTFLFFVVPPYFHMLERQQAQLEQFLGIEPILFAFLCFIASVSIYLAYTFASTNKSLERRLAEVEELSARTVEQERLAAERDVERKLLEADNNRKTAELEEARTLQLSMLPRTLPVLPELDIAAYMETATEVGGDYYDFSRASDGSLVVAVGDATGHGTKAGYFVSTTKSYFQSNAKECEMPELASRISSGLANMNLRGMFMALTLIKITGNTALITAAGMPPVLILRADGSVEEILLKSMPLGVFPNIRHEQRSITLASGDAIIVMSDGFPERFNEQSEILGYETAKALCNISVAKLPERSAQAIINELVLQSRLWAGMASLNDDMTFVVLAIR